MAVASSPARRAPIGGDRHGAKSELLDQLAQGVLDLTSARSWTRWLRVSRRFHKYSFQNQVLILRQRPEATWVAGYRTWVSLGRQVRQGERAIRILAPCLAPQDSLEGQELPAPVLIGFRIARVFDLSQTSGEALPEPVKTLSGSGSPRDLAQLGQRALCLGFQVQFTSLWGSRNGDCSHALRRIRVRERSAGSPSNQDPCPRVGARAAPRPRVPRLSGSGRTRGRERCLPGLPGARG